MTTRVGQLLVNKKYGADLVIQPVDPFKSFSHDSQSAQVGSEMRLATRANR